MKRTVYQKIIDAINFNSIPILIGMRRVGKTTLLKQLSEAFDNSLLINCDYYEYLKLSDIDFKKFIDKKISDGYTTILLDEIQVRETFDILLKNLYDEYMYDKKIKVVATGSSSISFAKKDTGVTRTRKIIVNTWSFGEYCEFTKKERTKDNFIKYLGLGGFPEFIDKNISLQEAADAVIKPILFSDIPTQYNINPISLNKVLNYIALNSNGEFNKNACSKDIGVTIAQVEHYIDIFQKAQLVKIATRVDENGKWNKNRKQKVYINPHIHLMLLGKSLENIDDKFIGQIVESYYLFNRSSNDGYYFDYYYMKNSQNNKEIDFVELSLDSKYIFGKAIEFKFTEGITKNYFQTLVETHAKDKIVYCLENHKDTFVEFKSILDI